MRKIAQFHVTNAPLVAHPHPAAPNVPIVHPVNIKTVSTTNAMHVQQDTNRKLKTQKIAPNVELATKVNSVEMDPACVFFAMLVNFNPNPVHANSVQPVRMPVIKE